MQMYVIRRLLVAIPTIVGVSILTFALVRLLPGDIAAIKCGRECTDEQRTIIRQQLGVDRPIPVQYGDWIRGIATGDLGVSLYTHKPVFDEWKQRIPVTVELAILAMAVAITIALPFGIISAVRQDTALDYVVRVVVLLGLAVPNFWVATLIFTIPAIVWGWVPPTIYRNIWDDPLYNLRQMILPALILGYTSAAILMRLTRSSLLEVLRQDYIRTASAKGLKERLVVVRHALKNALIPVITVAGFQFSFLLGGTVIIEQIFAIPGLGRSTFESIFNRDYPQTQINVLFLSTMFVLINLAVDLTYGVLDPRIRYR